jgi:hypothetical protein
MSTLDMEVSVSPVARSASMHAGGIWAVLLTSLGMLGCAGIDDVTDSSALASDGHESVMRDSLGTALAPISATIASSNADAALDLNLLARIEVQPNEMLEIYEPAPGVLLVSGVGAPAGEALLSAQAIEGLSVEEIWQLGAGSTEMPGELRAAIARASKRDETASRAMQEGIEPPDAPLPGFNPQPDPPGLNPQPEPPGFNPQPDPPGFNPQPDPPGFNPQPDPSTSSGWCDAGYFSSGYGDCPPGWDFSVCLNDWWNGAYAYSDGAFYAYTNVCPATGPVVLRIDSDHGGGGIWTVNQNTVRWWAQDDFDCGTLFDWDCLTVRTDVEQASGDRFHLRFRALN